MNKLMILKANCDAMHKTGNLKREYEELIRIQSEDDLYYIGTFEEGIGFINIKFKKEDCRNLTKEEIIDLNGKWYFLNGQPLYKIYLDEEGNLIDNNTKKLQYKIVNIFDKKTKEVKHQQLLNKIVRLDEDDLNIGKSLIMNTDCGNFIKTSKVEEVKKEKDFVEVITMNTIFILKK